MSLAALWRIVVRRRWLLVPALVLSLLAGAAGYMATPPSYSQSQSYLLLSPVITDSGRGNPFLQLGNGVAMAASVLSKRVSGGEVAATIAGSEPGLGYAVNLDPTTSAPVLVVTAEAPNPVAVTSALERIEETLTDELAALQDAAGAPEISWVTISPLAGDVAPLMSRSEGMRAGLVGAAGVLLLALLVVAALELLRTRKQYRASQTEVPAVAAQPQVPAASAANGRPDRSRTIERHGSVPAGRPSSER